MKCLLNELVGRKYSWICLFRRFSESDDDTVNTTSYYATPRGSVGGSSFGTISPRASIQHDAINQCSSKVGVVITSYRQSHRR